MPADAVAKRPPMVCVEWGDAWSDTREVEAESHYFRDPWITYSTGFLLHKSAKVIAVSLCWHREHPEGDREAFKHTMVIPLGMVRRITYLEGKKRTKPAHSSSAGGQGQVSPSPRQDPQ